VNLFQGGVQDYAAAAAERHDRLRSALKASMSGTPAYCAPERLDSDEQFETFAVDVWSLGCICYFMLFGLPPFYSDKEDDEEHDDEIAELVFDGTIVFPADKPISPYAKAFLHSMLTQDVESRAMVHELLMHPWLHGEASGAPFFEPSYLGPSESQARFSRQSLKSSMNMIIDHAVF
jgi:serine/threonine protein kinase